ncbi:MFS transporter [Paenibacillus sp. sgz5001063]|uniref:MFS transporter n=1 Tax=Paenibacillus sp. sgz5001063 TaxID=3242474 RepID=UPI0036D42B09
MKENQGNTASAVKLTANKPFVLLITAQLVSNIGDWLHILALLTMVGLKWEASPWEITAVSLCMAVPMLLGGPFAGYLSDMLDRKAIMIGSDVVRAGIVACLVFAGSLWQVYILLLAKGVLDVMFSPAKSGKLKELVPSEQMDQAVALSSSIEQITKIIGPAIGGLLVAAVGISACYIIDSVSYIISAVILLALPRVGAFKTDRGNEGSDTSKLRHSFRKEAGAGLKLIAGMPVVLSGVVMIVAALLVLQIADSQIVTLFREIPGAGADVLGWCVAASGFGTLFSALVVGRMGSSRYPLVFMAAGTILMGSVFASAGLVTAYGQAGLWMNMMMFGSFVLAGVGAGFVIIPFNSMLQRRTPEAYTGRVFGIVGSLTSAAVILGPIAGGALVTASGPVSAFIVSGVLAALLGASLLFLRPGIEKRDGMTPSLEQTVA